MFLRNRRLVINIGERVCAPSAPTHLVGIQLLFSFRSTLDSFFSLNFFFLLHSYVACILVNCEKNKSDMPTVCPQPEIQRTSFFFFLKYNNLFLLFCLSCLPQQREQSRDENLRLCTFKRSRDATYITPMITPMMITAGKRERNASEE